ncbi:hypothetical protein [Nocardia callitridis]|uniref:Uncharacterized protein n=1 Tax=Nocardia callitridis TaxID=648753 RepID=A0ABP9JUY2_9NOCA
MNATATWSEFLRDPNRIIDDMERNGDITLLRRSAPSVRLSDEAAAAATEETLSALTLLIAAVMDDEVLDRLVERLALPFPWIELLPQADRTEFIADFLAHARGDLAIGRVSALSTTLAAWRDTAAAYADSRLGLGTTDLTYLDKPVPVERPEPEVAEPPGTTSG